MSDKMEAKMAQNTKISARLSCDILSQVDAFASALQITRSEALERLIITGFSNVERGEQIKNMVIQRLEKLEKVLESNTNRLANIQVKTHKKATLVSLLSLNMTKVVNNMSDDQIRTVVNAAEAKAIEDLRNG